MHKILLALTFMLVSSNSFAINPACLCRAGGSGVWEDMDIETKKECCALHDPGSDKQCMFSDGLSVPAKFVMCRDPKPVKSIEAY